MHCVGEEAVFLSLSPVISEDKAANDALNDIEDRL